MAGLFREKNLEKISNPDNLDDYIHVSKPSIWIVIIVVALIIAAGIVWSVCGTISEKAPGVVVISGGKAACYIDSADASRLQSGDTIDFQSSTGMVTTSVSAPEPLSAVAETSGFSETEFRTSLGAIDWVCEAGAAIDLPDGIYPVSIVLDVYPPSALIFGATTT